MSERKKQKLEDSSAESNKISKSCDLCKLKKVKCDGLRPLCSFCSKNQMPACHYSLMKKPGLKPGYGKTMVQRLDHMEDEVKALKDQLRSILAEKNSNNNNNNHNHNDNRNGSVMTTRSGDSTSSLDSSSVGSNSASIQVPNLLNPRPNDSLGLPSISQCLLLVDLFFLKISPMFPLLHPSLIPSLEKSIKGIEMKKEPSLIVYAIILVTIKFLNSDQMSSFDKILHYNSCKEKIISTSLKKINLENLQSLILLAYDLLGNTVKVPESWNYVSIASDYATYLKLNDEKSIVRQSTLIGAGDSPSSINSSSNSMDTIAKRKSKSISNRSLNLLKKPKNWIDEESRRHCFWCIYILDKLYAISSSHEMKLKSNKINCLLPLKLKHWFDSNNQLSVNYAHQQRTLRLTNYDSPQSVNYNNVNLNANVNMQNVNISNVNGGRRDSSNNPSPLSGPNSSEDIYDSFAFYIELNKLMGDIHTFSIEEININDSYEVGNWKMKFKNLENHLFFWMNSLPMNYRLFLENAGHDHELSLKKPVEIYDIMFFVYYYTTLIKLHSAAGYPHGESEYFKSSEDSKRICLDSAERVYKFVSSLVSITNDETIFEKMGPLFGFYIWINSRILFVNVVYQSAEHLRNNANLLLKYQNMLSFFSDVLLKIGKIWESSMVYYKILQFLNVSDLSYVITSSSPANHHHNPSNANTNDNDGAGSDDESEENSDEEITGENREPASVFSDMRIGSHSLVFWFNKLAGKPTGLGSENNFQNNSLFDSSAAQNLASFQTSSAQSFEEFQLTHDEFFNFLALDINGSGSFQDMR